MTVLTLILALIATTEAEPGRGPVLLDFHSQGCGPCREMRPAIAQLIRSGYPVKSFDVEESPELAQRYGITAVPAFLVVDGQGRVLARTQGLQPAEDLATMFRKAKAKLMAQQPPKAPREDRTRVARDEEDEGSAEDDEEDQPEADAPLPKPWETVVRIRIPQGNGAWGFGSGTIIHSTDDEAIVLTCAHIFKLEGVRSMPPPAKFPAKILVDLFDGKLHGQKPAMVHYQETVPGRVVDYDFKSDVGLIRIKTTRRLPSARVVPASWSPKPKMEMITVGCSEGRDASAWTTWIINPQAVLRYQGHPYEAVECVHAPKQGRSGGGLFTLDGYVAGVCDLAMPDNNHGFYASPRSIHRLLDRNKLMALYEPTRDRGRSGELVAQNRPTPRRAPADTLRAQSPDRTEKPVPMPAPELLGVTTPPAVAPASSRSAWHSTTEAPTALASARHEVPHRRERPIPTDAQMAPELDDALDVPAPAEEVGRPAQAEPAEPTTPGRWKAVRAAG
jgi:thiol-disulfide isomerase/thioredoxin